MKKQLLLLTFILFAIYPAIAQFNLYHSFPDSNAYWGEESQIFNGISLDVYDYGYTLLGDTVMNSKTYHKLYKSEGLSNTGPVTPNTIYYGAIREDSLRHVYINTTSIGRDSLLYDFSLKVGDTLKQFNSNSAISGGINYIYKIDSTFIDGGYRKQFVIATDASTPHQQIDSIVEGIGSMVGLVEPVIGNFEDSYRLLCFHQNGNVVYSGYSGYFTYTCTVFGPTAINNVNDVIHSIMLYPNPATTSITISFTQPLGQANAVLRLYNAMGQLIRNENINRSSNDIQEDVSDLSGGIYYYTLSINSLVTATSKLVIIR